MTHEATLAWRDVGLDMVPVDRRAVGDRGREPAESACVQDSRSISSARRTSARDTAIRAASALALPCAFAIS